MVVANGGQLYVFGKDNNWWLWLGAGWARVAPPTLPPSPASPLTVPSPDGTVLLPYLQTAAGIWMFGSPNPRYPGNWSILLNGQVTSGIGSEMAVANGGQLYVYGVNDDWWLWLGQNSWSMASDPLQAPPPPPPPPPTTVINDNDPSIIYSRHDSCCDQWLVGNNSGDFDGDEHYSNVTRNPYPGTQVYGADVVVNFTGTGITWIGRVGPQFGIAAYSVDGGPVSLVDSYHPTVVYQTQNAVISGLAPGSHSLKIEVTSSKNASATDYYQVIDAFQIAGSGASGIQPSATLGSLSMPSHLTAPSGGGWGCGTAPNNPSDISGSHCFQSSIAQSGDLTWTFNGSMVEVFGRPDCENGYSQMYIDRNLVTTTDWVYGTIDDDLVNSYAIFTWKGAPGQHTIDIHATGTTDSQCPNGKNTWALVQIDILMAFP